VRSSNASVLDRAFPHMLMSMYVVLHAACVQDARRVSFETLSMTHEGGTRVLLSATALVLMVCFVRMQNAFLS